MKREELTTTVLNLHEQAKKKSEFSDLLISRVQLEGQVAKMDYETLNTVIRFYEALLEESNS